MQEEFRLQTFVTDGRNGQYETMSHLEKKGGIIICLGSYIKKLEKLIFVNGALTIEKVADLF